MSSRIKVSNCVNAGWRFAYPGNESGSPGGMKVSGYAEVKRHGKPNT
ncbi:hypothetical protein CSC00_3620 [Klebsiella pneumoniae]|nr:hypothetical protein CSC00_3620 [Klebsiella pneumoniae]